ncbi:MAG: hypothetical protein WCP15_00840 [bacterium]
MKSNFVRNIWMTLVAIVTFINLNSTLLGAEMTNTPVPMAKMLSTNKMFSVDISSIGSTKYLQWETGLPLHEGPVIQNEVIVTHVPTGLYLDLWNSYAFSGKLSEYENYGNEIDFIFGWSKTTEKGWNWDVGMAYINEPPFGTWGKNDSIWPYVKFGKNQKVLGQEVNFYGRFDSYTPLRGSGYKGDKIFSLGTETTFEVTSWLSVPVKSDFGYVTEGMGMNTGGFRWKGQIGTEWKVLSWMKITFPTATVYRDLGWNEYKSDWMFWGGFKISL